MDLKTLEADLKKVPWWGYGLIGGGGLAAIYYAKKAGLLSSSGAKGVPASSAASSAQPEQQPPDGLSMTDLAGLPVDYYDWSAAITPGGQPLPANPPSEYGTPTNPVGRPAPREIFGDVNPPGPNDPPIVTPPTIPPHVPTPTGAPVVSQPAPRVQTHTVEAWPAWDSTLSGIASHYGMSWQQLYHFGNDEQIIDSAAHAHGHYGDEYNWLFPGEVLQVP